MLDKIKTTIRKKFLNNFPALYKRFCFSNFFFFLKSISKEPEIILLKQLVHASRPVFDIGANRGEYTFEFEKLVSSSLIYAFEPIPELNAHLRKVFPRVNILDFAISNINGVATFKIPEVNHKVLFSRSTLQTQLTEKNETGKFNIKVNTITIDSFVQQQNINDIGFIKIDVEGNEFNVIKGGIITIKKYKPIMLIEIEQRHHSGSINEIIHSIKNLGYTCFYLNKKLKLKELKENAERLQIHGKGYINNFIFIPN